ncbi:hypothetical protein GH714_030770 [Hevea brasiliensis]|uniref:non-specific serine/threonine protein kinase n=1 Tax=Hevea brasiliensis TaxID=3981 RepID=A0A6A6LHP8_HEVBR|nr:hypothetical protein GH714_030770 [Hevea brasiliensis]
MQTHLPHSQLVPFDSLPVTSMDSESQKAWHLLSLLLSLGHPTSPLELASRCTLFRATPDLIISLCSTPNSPITLTTSSGGLHVTVSLLGLFAFQRFVSNINLIGSFLTPIGTQVCGPGMLKDVVRVYFRKRKRIGFDSGEVDENYGSVSLPLKRIRNAYPKVHFQIAQGISRSINAESSFVSNKTNMILPPALFSKTMGNSVIYNLRNAEQVDDEMNTSVVESKEHKRIMAPKLDEESALLRKMLGNQAVCQEIKVDEADLKSRTDIDATFWREDFKQITILPEVCASVNDACDAKQTPPRHQAVNQSLEGSKPIRTPGENHQVKRNLVAITKAQKSRKRDNMLIKDGRKDVASFSHMDQVETKGLPCFQSYIAEEEEGSGGYGIVYRARRKSDGTTVAIKCPHANANKHHISNELRMLERFGGKNFVIKYEGCIKSGNSDCFVLEHVEHDRPEALKKEINIYQLQWYGYCMFRALASLHKQGIVHRDVKPGNFLFSRKANKGYLIDFNLAMDLSQKYRATNKLKAGNDVCFNHVALPNAKSIPPPKNSRIPSAKSLDAFNQEATKT